MNGLDKIFKSLFSTDPPPGRDDAMEVENRHFVKETNIQEPFPKGARLAMFGMGCFWGAERRFWQLEGVHSTAAGYAGGKTPNPNYREVCGGRTGHNEVVRVVYEPEVISYADLLRVFWEGHDSTQGMRQGNDIGEQYRSGIYICDSSQRSLAEESLAIYQKSLTAAGFGKITTEIVEGANFYYAEDYHQQYLGKNPGGYCGLGGLPVPFVEELTQSAK